MKVYNSDPLGCAFVGSLSGIEVSKDRNIIENLVKNREESVKTLFYSSDARFCFGEEAARELRCRNRSLVHVLRMFRVPIRQNYDLLVSDVFYNMILYRTRPYDPADTPLGAWARVHADSDLQGWIWKTAYRIMVERIRDGRRYVDIGDGADLEITLIYEKAPEKQYYGPAEDRRLLESLDRMGGEGAALLRDIYFSGHSQGEIARRMGISDVKLTRLKQKAIRELTDIYLQLERENG